MHANSAAYAAFKLQGNPDGFQSLPPVAVIYLGSTLRNASTASGAHISPITANVTLQDGNIYQFESTWRPQTGVSYLDPWDVPASLRDTRPNGSTLANPIPIFVGIPGTDANGVPATTQLTQVSNPANYVGWNSNFHNELLRYNDGEDLSLLTAAAKSLRVTKSYAGTWQGYLWNDAIVPTLGWRYDEVKSKGVVALPGPAATRGALNINPDVYKLPDAFPVTQIFKDHSTSGGLVVHLNKLLGESDFLPINVSLSYNKSSNFQVTDVRRDIYGGSIPNPTGATKEYGVLLSTKDDKYSFRAIKYETSLAGASTPLSLSTSQGSLTGTIKDAMNWRNIKTYYMSAYNWNTAGQTDTRHYSGARYMWDAVWLGANGRPIASGNIPAGDPRLPAGAVKLETQEEADARRDASIAAINNFQVWLNDRGYFSAWNYGPGPTTQGALQTRG